jgi:hypothetical protein
VYSRRRMIGRQIIVQTQSVTVIVTPLPPIPGIPDMAIPKRARAVVHYPVRAKREREREREASSKSASVEGRPI